MSIPPVTMPHHDAPSMGQNSGISVQDLPSHWRVVRVGDVYRFTTKPRDVRFSDYDAIPFVPMECIPIGQATFDRYLLKPIGELTSGTYFEAGDVLVSKITPSFENGKQGVIERLPLSFGIATTEVIPIGEIEGVSDRFFLLYYLLRRNVRAMLAGKMEGSTGRQRLSKSTVEKLEIPLPPLPEQRSIARILRTVEDTIHARRREIAVERERKAALMQHLFTHGTRDEPRKQTDIGEIPQSWQLVPLGTIAALVSGGTPSKARSDWWQGDIPWASPKDLKRPRLADVQDHITREAAEAGSRIVPGGTVFIVIRGMILAKDIPVAITEVPMAFNQDMKAILPGERIVGDFVLYALQYLKPYLNIFIGTSAHGTRRLGTSSLEEFLIPLPSIDEQKIIALALEACDTRVAMLEEETALLEEFFRAMLEELMTGRLSALPVVSP